MLQNEHDIRVRLITAGLNAGVHHLALLTDDLLGSLEALDPSVIEILDIGDEYYETASVRVLGVTQDPTRIRAHQVLMDGDRGCDILQTFMRNIIGPIFIEMIQCNNHQSFGEGKFGALFRFSERDQQRLSVL